MRRSFGSGNKNMGGGGNNGGGMLKSLSRAITRSNLTSTASANSSAKNNSNRAQKKPNSPYLLSLSNSSSSRVFVDSSSLLSPNWSYCEDFEWICVDDVDKYDGTGNDDDDEFVVPSVDEVQFALSALQQAHIIRDTHKACLNKNVEHNVTLPTSFGSELGWIEPSMQYCDSKMLQPHGNNLVYDAFHLLQTDKSVQRMVLSLSSDNAVWNAVLNNEAVRELKESYVPAEDQSVPSLDEDSDGSKSNETTDIVQWIFDNTVAKATELFQTIMKLVSDLIQPSARTGEKTGEAADPFEEKLRASFFLTVVVLLVVVVSRAHKG